MFPFSTPNPTRILIRGIMTLLVGAIIAVVPDLSIDMVVRFLGILLVLDGFINLLPAFFKKSQQQNIFVIVPRGTTSIIIGAFLLLFPQLVVGIFVFLIGFVLLIVGLSQLFMQLSRIRHSSFSWLLLLFSVLAFCAGIFMLFFPKRISFAIVIITGFIIAFYGIWEIFWSFRIRKQQKRNAQEQPGVIDTDYEEVE